jgi:UDP-N-acetylenolpyruvoylglucosamine reductase
MQASNEPAKVYSLTRHQGGIAAEIESMARNTGSMCRTYPWLKRLTTHASAGAVAAIIYPRTFDGVARLTQLLDRTGIAWRVMGDGNVMGTAPLDGETVALSLRLLDEPLTVNGNRLTAHAGHSLAAISEAAAERSLSGLEGFASSTEILGLALRQNVELWQLVEKVVLVRRGEVRMFPAQDEILEIDRTCMRDRDLIMAATLKLMPGNGAARREATIDRKPLESHPVPEPAPAPATEPAQRLLYEFEYELEAGYDPWRDAE